MPDLLRTAVLATIRAEVRQDSATFETVAQHIDVRSFLDSEGEIDMTKVAAFASKFSTAPQVMAAPIDPVAAALERQRAHVADSVDRARADHDYEQQFADGHHRPAPVPPDASVGEGEGLAPEYNA